MGQVAVTIKVMPESPETDLDKIKSQIKKAVSGKTEIKNIKETAIAFGLKQLEILLLMPDQSGGTDEIEDKIRKIKGVSSVECGDITLI